MFALIEAFTSAKGVDRSKLFALSVQAFMAADRAHQAASAAAKWPRTNGSPTPKDAAAGDRSLNAPRPISG